MEDTPVSTRGGATGRVRDGADGAEGVAPAGGYAPASGPTPTRRWLLGGAMALAIGALGAATGCAGSSAPRGRRRR